MIPVTYDIRRFETAIVDTLHNIIHDAELRTLGVGFLTF